MIVVCIDNTDELEVWIEKDRTSDVLIIGDKYEVKSWDQPPFIDRIAGKDQCYLIGKMVNTVKLNNENIYNLPVHQWYYKSRFITLEEWREKQISILVDCIF